MLAWGIAAVVAALAVLFANWRIVNARVRNAEPRDGGKIIETEIVPANVKVEGEGPNSRHDPRLLRGDRLVKRDFGRSGERPSGRQA